MRGTIVVLFLVAGFANSAIVDSSKSPLSKPSDWDDDDSMTLASTTTASQTSNDDATQKPLPVNDDAQLEDQIVEEQNRPRFISLIPAGTHSASSHSKSDQEDSDRFKYQVNTPEPTTVNSNESEQDDGSTSTPASTSSEENTSSQDSVDEQSTTENAAGLKHIQLGKFPLTYEIMPLLPPREEKQQLLGREDTKPIGFFPPEHSMMMMDRQQILRQEQEKQQQTQNPNDEVETTEIITGRPVPDLKELPSEPLPYMAPPRRDDEMVNLWHQYPQPTTTINMKDLELPQSTTLNPLLERINDFLMKAKRHSLEMETTTGNAGDEGTTTVATSVTSAEDDDPNTEQVETTTSAEQMVNKEKVPQENFGITDPLTPVSDTPEDSNGDLNPSSPAPIPEEPTEEDDDIVSTSREPTILFPRRNFQPDIMTYSPEVEQVAPAYYSTPQSMLPSEYSPSAQSVLPEQYSPLPQGLLPVGEYSSSTQNQLPEDYSPSPSPNQVIPGEFVAPPQPLRPGEYLSSSLTPPLSNDISTLRPSMDQYYSDYSNLQQRPFNRYYYTNSNNPAAVLQRRTMISPMYNYNPPRPSTTTLPPNPPIYISPNSYWPRKYFTGGNAAINRNSYYQPTNNNNNYLPAGYSNNNNYNYNSNYNNNNNNYNPYMSSGGRGGYNGYDYYLRPQRQSFYYPTSTSTTPSISIGAAAALSRLLSSTSEEPSYSPSSYGNYLNDYSSNANSYYSPGDSSVDGGNDNYYAYQPASSTLTENPSSYLNYRSPMIPYRSSYSYPITSSALVNELMMYAPLFPHRQYRRYQQQPAEEYF